MHLPGEQVLLPAADLAEPLRLLQQRSGALALFGAPPGDHDAVEQRGDVHAEHRCRGQAPPVCGQGLAGEGLRLAGRQDGGGPVEETAGQRRPRVQLQQASDYVTKPVDTKELLSCMERWLQAGNEAADGQGSR